MINGIATMPDNTFAIGWQSCNPVRFKNLGNVKINGKKKIPCRQLERKILCDSWPHI